MLEDTSERANGGERRGEAAAVVASFVSESSLREACKT
jgi:hypothetical protein